MTHSIWGKQSEAEAAVNNTTPVAEPVQESDYFDFSGSCYSLQFSWRCH